MRQLLRNTFYLIIMAKRKHRFSIKMKVITMIAILAAVILGVGLSYYSIMVAKLSKETYSGIANDISKSTAQVINVNDVKTLRNKVEPIVKASPTKPLGEESSQEELNAYLAQFDGLQSDAEFVTALNNTKTFLTDFAVTNSEFVDCLYVQYVDFDNEFVVYLCDTDTTETSCHPGQLDPIHYKGVLEDRLGGFKPQVTKTERYGSLIVAGAPIKDGNDIVAYAMVDIQMELVRGHQSSSIVRLTIYLLVTLLLLGVAGVIWASVWMIRPLKKLRQVTSSYNSINPKETHENFEKLDINTGDEIQDLAESLKIMENDVFVRFNELIETNRLLISSKEETKKMEMLANQDGLTGVKNKVSYNAEVSRINEMIKNGEYTNFAVVMVDLNYLKDTNDTYGHDTGDIALIRLAELICETFKFSPVYRVGGDEFVVISRSKDYLRVDKLVDELKKKTNKTIDVHDGENISAAIGFSTYNPQIDKTVDDVFKRADKAMYEHKRELKKNDK